MSKPNNKNLDKARTKAMKSPEIGKRGKGKATIARQQALERLSEYFLDAFDPIVQAQIKKAKKGDFAAYKDLMDRIFGQSTQKIKDESAVREIDKLRDEVKKMLK